MKLRQGNVIASRPAKGKSEGDEWIPFAVKTSSAPDRSGLMAFLRAGIVKNGIFVRKGAGAHTPPLKVVYELQWVALSSTPINRYEGEEKVCIENILRKPKRKSESNRIRERGFPEYISRNPKSYRVTVVDASHSISLFSLSLFCFFFSSSSLSLSWR